MRLLTLLVAVYLAAVVQTTWAAVIEVRGVGPDLLLLVVVVWMATGRGAGDVLAAGCVGLVAGCISPGRPGVAMACFLIAAAVVVRLRRRSMNHLPTQVLFTGIVVTTVAAVEASVFRITGETTQAWTVLLAGSLGVGIYTAGVSVAVWMVAGWCHQVPVAARQPVPVSSKQRSVSGAR